MAFSSGMLLACLLSSAPSAMIQRGAFFHSGLIQQHGERDARPQAATGEAVGVLDCGVGAMRAAPPGPAVALSALHSTKCSARHGGQAANLIHGENQRTIDHAVNHQAVLARVDVGRLVGVGNHVVERGGRDEADACPAAERASRNRGERSGARPPGGYMSPMVPLRTAVSKCGALAIGVEVFSRGGVFGCGGLGSGLSETACGEASQRGTFEKSPARLLIGGHRSSRVWIWH